MPAASRGLIVIDEEHEGSFKQATAPRYHARDVAEWIARAEGVPLVLGSATPALETFARCLAGEWRMCRLADRVGGSQLPAVITAGNCEPPTRSASRHIVQSPARQRAKVSKAGVAEPSTSGTCSARAIHSATSRA